MRNMLLAIAMLLGCCANVAAKVEVLSFSGPEHEARYKKLVGELRCLVCQNQNIAASDADLAKDLRRQVFTRIENGETDAEIIDYMVARYGEFVLYKPPLNAKTALLWIGPFALLAAGIAIMIWLIRSRRSHAVMIPEASVERARNLLKDQNKIS